MRYRHTKINYYVHSPSTDWHNSRPVLLSSSYASRNVSKISTPITEEKKICPKNACLQVINKKFYAALFFERG